MKFTFSIITTLLVTTALVIYFNQEDQAQGKETQVDKNSEEYTEQALSSYTEPSEADSNAAANSSTNGAASDNYETTPQEEYLRVFLAPLYHTTLSTEVVVTTVKEINKRMGESFQKGEVLMKLDDTVFAGLMIKAQGNLQKAQAQLDAKEQLYQDSIASNFDVKAAIADMAAAQSELINAKYSVDACIIHAPYDGSVVNVLVEKDELVQQGKPLIEVVDDTILLGKVLVPSTLLNRIQIGQLIKVKIRETNTIVNGKILRIDSVIDPASSTIKVDIEIDNRDKKLRAGMIGTIRITYG